MFCFYQVPPVWSLRSKMVMESKVPWSRKALAAAKPPGPPPMMATFLMDFWINGGVILLNNLDRKRVCIQKGHKCNSGKNMKLGFKIKSRQYHEAFLALYGLIQDDA